MRKHHIIWLGSLVLFLLETTVFHWIIPLGWQQNISITPRFVMAIVLFVALFGGRHFALVLGLVFGLLYDLVFYGYMIGPYAFGMGLIGYITGLIFRKKADRFMATIVIITLGLFSLEMIHFGIYRLFRIIDFTLSWTFVHHMLPSLLINLLFTLIVYNPMRFVLEKLDSRKKERED